MQVCLCAYIRGAYCYIYIYIYIDSCRIHTDAINKQVQEDFFNKIFTSHFIARVRKSLLKVCAWEGAGDRTETAIFWPQTYGCQRRIFLVLLMLNRRPRGLLCWVMAFFYGILSASSPDLNSSGLPEGPLGRVWFSLPHLVYISVSNSTATVTRTQLNWVI